MLRPYSIDSRNESVILFTKLERGVTATMSEPKNPWVQTGELLSIGMLILVSTLGGLGLGYWLDGKLGTTPWLAFALTLVGLGAGLYETVRILIKATRD